MRLICVNSGIRSPIDCHLNKRNFSTSPSPMDLIRLGGSGSGIMHTHMPYGSACARAHTRRACKFATELNTHNGAQCQLHTNPHSIHTFSGQSVNRNNETHRMNKFVMRTRATRWRTLSQLHELNLLLVCQRRRRRRHRHRCRRLATNVPKKTKQANGKKNYFCEGSSFICPTYIFFFAFYAVWLPLCDSKTCIFLLFGRSFIHRLTWTFMLQFKYASTVQLFAL